MGHLKEPAGITFTVDPTPLTVEGRKKISAVIAHYKATGKKVKVSKQGSVRLSTKISKRKVVE
jgi:hypothetical protein